MGAVRNASKGRKDMEIYGKSKLNENTHDKIKKGAQAIEIHTDEYDDFDLLMQSPIIKQVKIKAVHAPLKQYDDTRLEHKSSRRVIEKTCQLADKISTVQRHKVIVVCHLGTHPDELKDLGVYEDIVEFVQDLADQYQNLEFAIENVTHLELANDRIHLRDTNYMAPIILTKDINRKNVGTCLDICHALMEMRFMKNTLNYIKGVVLECQMKQVEKGLSEFFAENKNTIKLIHLATAKEHGLGQYHGKPFEEDDELFLKGLMKFYYDYNYTCPITIEVQEDDYTNGKNFEKTFKLLNKILRECKKD